MQIKTSHLHFKTAKEHVTKYIVLKIQSLEWQKGIKIPSERWFMIKFNISKSLISSILNSFKQQNILYSIPKKGNFVSKKE
jgi:DNA-binding GntR family transcriptional regulator